jgi:hypothetical protein
MPLVEGTNGWSILEVTEGGYTSGFFFFLFLMFHY